MISYNYYFKNPKSGTELLVIEAFTKEGQPLSVPYIYASDIEGEPFQHSFEKDQSGRLVCPLLDDPFFLNALWEVEGFGKIIATADNEGQGYKKGDFEDEATINLNYEIAKSHFKKVADTYESCIESGYNFSTDLRSQIEESRSHLENARNASDEAKRASFSDKSLNYSLWAGEKLVLETARMDIEKYRKVDVTIKVVDESGNPVENATVVVKQLDHEIMFACNTRGFEMQDLLTDFEAYKQKFKELFNSGMVHFFWPMFEPEEGKYQWESRDAAVNWLKSNGLRVWGHLLIWLHEWSVPEWAKRKSYEELKEVLSDLCYGPVDRYRDEITLWNVFNEPEWGNVLGLSVDQQMELLELGMNVTREANPDAVRMINPTIVWGEYVAWGLTAEGPATRNLLTPYQFLKEVNKRGIEYEAVGLQLYMGSGGVGSGFTVRDMLTISELLDKYAKLGKPIHITEFGVPSKFVDVGDKVVTGAGYWHKPWDEEVQADWVEQFYTIAFSKPYVESISWFDLADYTQVFIAWSGLLNEDMSPKQSYHRLKQILNSWITSNEGTTNSQGEYSLRGFKGPYEITIKKDGRIVASINTYFNTGTTKTIEV